MTTVFCADVGSVNRGCFAWAAQGADGTQVEGTDMLELTDAVAKSIKAGEHVALGFECPLFVPLAPEPRLLLRARLGEGNRPWSAGAGCGSLATGLVQATFVLGRVRELLPTPTGAFLS